MSLLEVIMIVYRLGRRASAPASCHPADGFVRGRVACRVEDCRDYARLAEFFALAAGTPKSPAFSPVALVSTACCWVRPASSRRARHESWLVSTNARAT